MTDNAAPSYQPTTSDGIPYQQATTGGIPYQQNTPAQYQPPIEVYQPVNSYGSDVTYRTPCNCIVGFIVVIFFIVGVGVFSFMIVNGISTGQTQTILMAFIPLIFSVVATILGSCISLYVIINISATSGLIIINKKKMCFCFSKQEVVQINDLQQVIVQTDYTTHYEINGVHYDAFEVIFRLSDGREVKGCSGIIDKNGEGRRAFQIIRNALPQRIVFGGNLAF